MVLVPLFVNYSSINSLLFGLPRRFVSPHDPDIPKEAVLLWDTVKTYKLQVRLMPNDLMKEVAKGLVPNVQVVESLWRAWKWPI